jgi:hypothetical protein
MNHSAVREWEIGMSDDAKPHLARYGPVLELAVKSLAIATPIALFGAIVRDYGYWLEVGPDIFGLMTITDHVTAALEDLPILGIAVAVMFTLYGLVYLVLVVTRLVPTSIERAIDARLRAAEQPSLDAGMEKLEQYNRRLTWKPLIPLAVTMLVAALLLLVDNQSVRLLIIRCVAMGLVATGSFALVATHLDTWRGTIMAAACIYFILTFGVGVQNGFDAVNSEHKRTYFIEVGGGRSILRAAELRHLERGLFILDVDTMQGRIIPWSNLKEIRSDRLRDPQLSP